MTAAADEGVRRSEAGGVVTLVIDRPSSLNALNEAVLRALHGHVAELAGDEALRAVIITGGGAKAFVAGADIAAMREMGPAEASRFAALGHETLDAIEALPVPVLAAVNGFCLGGGCELALACDLVYASERARFGQPEVKLGLIPGFGGTQRLTRRVGAMRALELIATGAMLNAEQALSAGLCLAVLPPDALLSHVEGVAQTIASMGPVAVRAAKATLRRGAEAPLSVGNALERDAFSLLFATADTREGLSAFLEKRAPNFLGR